MTSCPSDFEVADGVVLPAGPYSFTNYSLELRLGHPPGRGRSTPSYTLRRLLFGPPRRVEPPALTLKLKGYANLAFDTDLVRGRLPEGNFSENVYQLKADFFLSPDLGLMNYIQFDDISNTLGWSARLRWQISPGNEVYLVYNRNWERGWDPRSRFAPLGDRGVIKISLSIRP